ncbi:MAG: TIR domain-containing protein, partial [Chloroflexota bacterium]|nr:TIR domain-containing protein [Chloroflexota bacterium]
AQSDQDEGLRKQLDDNLKLFETSGRIKGWHKREVRAGQEWATEINRYLNTAQIILLLVSSDFLASPSCYDEMMQAMARYERREAIVVPVLLRPGYYKGAPFGSLEMLPSNKKPITSWSNRDQAFENIVEGLDSIIEGLESVSGSVPAYFARFSSDAQPETHAHAPIANVITADAKLASGQALTCDVLLVTAISVEVLAVRDICQEQLQRSFGRYFHGQKTYFDLGSIGGARTFLVQSEMGAGGPSGSLLTVQEGIQVLSPSAVIMVGVAFGTNPKKQHLGDILVSRQLLGYELQRVERDANGQIRNIPRGDRPQASGRLLDRLRTGAIDWQGAPVHFGLMLSGDKLVDHPDFREYLRQMEPEAIGGEMEGAGLYAAAQRNKVDWIVVKGICDWADGKKSLNKDQRQQTAARNAVGFIFHVLQQGGLAVQR